MPFHITAGPVTLVQLRQRRKEPTTQGRRGRGTEGLACRQAQEGNLRRAPRVRRDGMGSGADSAPVFGAAVDGHTAPPGQHRRRIPPRGISTHQLKTMNDPVAPISEVTIGCPNSSPPRLKPLMPTGERTHFTCRDFMWLRRMRYECAALDDTPQTWLKHPVIDASESALHQPTSRGAPQSH